MNERFEKETCMCVVSEQDSHFPGIHYVLLYQGKKNTYFLKETLPTIASSLKDLLHKYLEDYNV